MKKKLVPFMAFLVLAAGCSPRHYYSCGFLRNPSFDLFGASLQREGGRYVVRSYIQSKEPFRTEYVYENFDVSFPAEIRAGDRMDMGDGRAGIWYAAGGEAGQIETRKARGSIIIKKITGREAVLDVDLEFYGFERKGSPEKPPEKIARRGQLAASAGYSLYK
ncbi:MAG: hypothetical protein MUD12_12850 [Spirochaetes bacterium]|jgi:hypothetical protein|nr:hypothetical protein [Spirochaetota bacterium]